MLSEDETVIAEALYNELSNVDSENSKRPMFQIERIRDKAYLLVRYGVQTLEAFRTTDETARRYLFKDIRKAEQLPFPDLSFLLKLSRRIPKRPEGVRKEPSLYGTRYSAHPRFVQTFFKIDPPIPPSGPWRG